MPRRSGLRRRYLPNHAMSCAAPLAPDAPSGDDEAGALWRVGPAAVRTASCLWRQAWVRQLSVTLLDGERRLYGRSREHPVVVGLKRWIGAWRRGDAGPES